MDAIKFPQHNVVLAENQPEYIPLPVFIDRNDPQVPMTACFKLNPDELKEIQKTGCLWLTQLTFGQYFQPIRMSTQNPF